MIAVRSNTFPETRKEAELEEGRGTGSVMRRGRSQSNQTYQTPLSHNIRYLPSVAPKYDTIYHIIHAILRFRKSSL